MNALHLAPSILPREVLLATPWGPQKVRIEMTEQTNETHNSDRVALARDMFVMLKEHTRAAAVNGMVPSQLNAHEVHELADGAARLIAATAPNAAPPRIGGKREGA